jgi:diguanylate cyclase
MEAPRIVHVPAVLARGALRRLAQAQLEPTPENYARAYADEAGQPAPAADVRGQSAA